MQRRTFTWRDPQFTYADALTGSRLIMLPFLIYVLGVLPWWKWLVIMVPAALMAWAQIIFFLRAAEVTLAQDVVGKLVGMIQYAYLPFLLGRTFRLKAGWAQTADHAIFAALAVANIFNTLDYARILRRLLVGGATPARR